MSILDTCAFCWRRHNLSNWNALESGYVMPVSMTGMMQSTPSPELLIIDVENWRK